MIQLLNKLIMVAMALTLATSCTTRKSFINYGTKHKDVAATFCSETFPVKPDTVTNTVYKPADNIDWTNTIDSLNKAIVEAKNTVKTDTVYDKEECNDKLQSQARTIKSLTTTVSRLKDQYKPCKPDTLIITNTITIPDSAAIYKWQDNYNKESTAHQNTKDELEDVKSERKWLRLILGGMLLLFVVLKFLRVI